MSSILTLCYHATSEDWDDPLSVAPDRLEQQLTWALARGLRPARLTEAVCGTRSEPTLVVTFDDAFGSVFANAFPVLDRLGIPGTVFVPTDPVTRGGRLAWEGLGAPPDSNWLEPMTWDQLRRLAAAGWEIGSHTRSHPYLTQLSDAARADELEASRADCEANIGEPCRSLAYPYGDVDAGVVSAARRAGYSVGAILHKSARGPRALVWPRVGVYRDDSLQRVRLKSARFFRTKAAMSAIRGARAARGTLRA